MQRIDVSEKLNYDSKFSSIHFLRESLSEEDRLLIKSLNCGISYHEFSNNICCNNEPSEEEINSIAVILKRVYHIEKYVLWYAKNINSYRLLFGF